MFVMAYSLIFFFSISSYANDVTVRFIEGYYKEDSSGASSKYSALVSVWRQSTNGYENLGSFRGSTLPNPYWVYKDSDGNPFDIDGRLHDIFNKFDSLDLESMGLGGLRPLVSVFKEDKKYPIIMSGIYKFKTVKHNRYNPRALILEEGGFVPTFNANPNQGGAFIANEIFVHKGRHTGVNRDSAGCITIDPEEWDSFIKLFPEGSTGVIEIVRGLLQRPWNLRVLQ